jgi:hypothetical protein
MLSLRSSLLSMPSVRFSSSLSSHGVSPASWSPSSGPPWSLGSPWSSAGDTAGGAAAPRASPLGERRGRTSSASDGHRCRAGAMSAAVAASSSGAPPDRYCATPNRVRSRLVPRARTSWRTRVVIGLGSPCVVGTRRWPYVDGDEPSRMRSSVPTPAACGGGPSRVSCERNPFGSGSTWPRIVAYAARTGVDRACGTVTAIDRNPGSLPIAAVPSIRTDSIERSRPQGAPL